MAGDRDGGFWSKQSELSKAVIAGLYGAPELRKGERDQLLGEFAERVLAAITKEDVRRPGVQEAIAAAAADPRAAAIVVHGAIPFAEASQYSVLAEAHHLRFAMRADPAYKGDVGLVVVSDE
jgi:uncharacterized protein YueI